MSDPASPRATAPPEARVYACPSCGAGVDELARACPFCRAPVATVRCASCFHMSPPHALCCSGCGLELGLEPIGEASEVPCPGCAATMTAFASPEGRLFDCAGCGGQFVERALLRALLERRELVGDAVPKRSVGGPPAPGPVRYLRCPVCRAVMSRKNFAGKSGVIVDVCADHGHWFDLGELPRILAFVEGGGLAKARAAEQAAQAAAARRPAGTWLGPDAATDGAADGRVSVDDIASVASFLIEELVHSLRGR